MRSAIFKIDRQNYLKKIKTLTYTYSNTCVFLKWIIPAVLFERFAIDGVAIVLNRGVDVSSGDGRRGVGSSHLRVSSAGAFSCRPAPRHPPIGPSNPYCLVFYYLLGLFLQDQLLKDSNCNAVSAVLNGLDYSFHRLYYCCLCCLLPLLSE